MATLASVLRPELPLPDESPGVREGLEVEDEVEDVVLPVPPLIVLVTTTTLVCVPPSVGTIVVTKVLGAALLVTGAWLLAGALDEGAAEELGAEVGGLDVDG
jgi:hypothetical protein